jgi:hypothetical protein
MGFPIAELKSLPEGELSLNDVAAMLGITRDGVAEALLAGPDLLLHVDSASFDALDPDFARLGVIDVRCAFDS